LGIEHYALTSRGRLEPPLVELIPVAAFNPRPLGQPVEVIGIDAEQEPGQALVSIEEEERPAAFFDEHDIAAIALMAAKEDE
jgi:hypothetical protein